MSRQLRSSADRGSVLLLTLFVVVVLGATVAALATYAATSVRATNGARDDARRQAIAEAALVAALDEIRAGTAGCLYNTAPVTLTDLDDVAPAAASTTTVTCQSAGGPIAALSHWAAVITGATLQPTSRPLQTIDDAHVLVDGPMWMPSLTLSARSQIGPPVEVHGPLVAVTPNDCSVLPTTISSDFDFEPPLVYRPVCTSLDWDLQPSLADPPMPIGLPAPGVVMDVGPNCQVYSPGLYDDDPSTPSTPDLPVVDDKDAYFQSGDYVFVTTKTTTTRWSVTVRSGERAIAGKSSTVIPDLTGWGCSGVTEYTNDSADGATFYFGNRARLLVEGGGDLEVMPRPAGQPQVSVQALCALSCSGLPASAHSVNPMPPGGSNLSIVRVDGSGSTARLRGSLYAPKGLVYVQENASAIVDGGLVAARVQVDDDAELTANRPASAGAPIELRLTATADDTKGTTTITAVVQYDPAAIPADRVDLTSVRLCAPAGC